MDPQLLAAQSLPMLDDVLGRIKLHRSGTPLDFPGLVHPFSYWVQEQNVPEPDFAFMVMLVGAFICEYTIARFAAHRIFDGKWTRLGIPSREGTVKVFDPYAAAVGIVRDRQSLADFLRNVGA